VVRIFLCHARDDRAQVREIYHRLRAIEGFEPWLDEEDLLPGQLWAREIPRALQTSDAVLIFLSRNSVAKRGYIQREMKMALDAWEELPKGTIHTIPVRLDDCDVPEQFRHYHWANLFEPYGFERIIHALHPLRRSPTVQSSETVNVQLTLDYDFAKFSTEERARVLHRLRVLLNLDDEISIIAIEPGSTKLTISLTLEQAEQLLWLYQRGVLNELHIKDAKILGTAAANAIVHYKAQSNSYDVFMCHNSEDKQQIKRIALRLRSRSILPWLDEWELRPGLPWQQALEEHISNIKSAAVFVGNSGIGPWQNMELYAFIRQFVQRQCPVIPVLLQTCMCKPILPIFLDGMTWVNFKIRNPNPYDQLIWGITGEKQ
jgi:hypothetical protein